MTLIQIVKVITLCLTGLRWSRQMRADWTLSLSCLTNSTFYFRISHATAVQRVLQLWQRSPFTKCLPFKTGYSNMQRKSQHKTIGG